MPVPTELIELIERRKQHILAEWGDAIDINDFPVVNDDTAFDEHCPYGTYTNAITRMLRECKLNEKTFGGAADDLRNNDPVYVTVQKAPDSAEIPGNTPHRYKRSTVRRQTAMWSVWTPPRPIKQR